MPFYVCLPFILERIRTPLHAAIILAAAIVVTTASRFWLLHQAGLPANYYNMAFTSYAATFACGLLAYRCFRAHKTPRALGGITLAWCALLPFRGTIAPYMAVPDDVVFWSGFFGLLTLWQAARPSLWLSNAAMQWLGERSFSIYLLHPFVIFMLIRHGVYAAMWRTLEPIIGSWAYLALAAVAFAIVLPMAGLSYRLIERPGQKIGKAIFLKPRLTCGSSNGHTMSTMSGP